MLGVPVEGSIGVILSPIALKSFTNILYIGIRIVNYDLAAWSRAGWHLDQADVQYPFTVRENIKSHTGAYEAKYNIAGQTDS